MGDGLPQKMVSVKPVKMKLVKSTKSNNDSTTKVKKEAEVLEISSDDDDIEEEKIVPYHLTIHGCGAPGINGTFTLSGYHDGAPRYSRYIGGYDMGVTYYTIQREQVKALYSEGIAERKWLILGTTQRSGGVMLYYTAPADDSNLPGLILKRIPSRTQANVSDMNECIILYILSFL